MQEKIDWIEIPQQKFRLGLSNAQANALWAHYGRTLSAKKELKKETSQPSPTIPKFYISRFPITWGQLDIYVKERHIPHAQLPPYTLDWADHPADHLLWWLAQDYCAGIGARLPTSYEWELAARGTDRRLWPWGTTWDPTRLNYGQDERRHKVDGTLTVPVGSYPEGASPYGVEDMAGGGREWTMTTQLARRPGAGATYAEHMLVRGHTPDPAITAPYHYRVTIAHQESLAAPGPGAGIRPVLDQWVLQNWPGFRVKRAPFQAAPDDT